VIAALAVVAALTPAYGAAVHLARDIGVRPAGSPAERRAERYVEGRFRAAGLRIGRERFSVPGHGRSGNVIGAYGPRKARCLQIVTAHADTSAVSPGGNDNASGVGVLVALAPRLRRLHPRCTVWLAATGAEERFVWGGRDHLGARALLHGVRRRGLTRKLSLLLDVDEMGRGTRFWLRSNAPRPRAAVEGRVLAAARHVGTRLTWTRDSGSGNSDHREFQLAGLPAVSIEVYRGADPCNEQRCDTWRRISSRSLTRVQRVAERVLR
jgi:aminopeptidase YwaD